MVKMPTSSLIIFCVFISGCTQKNFSTEPISLLLASTFLGSDSDVDPWKGVDVDVDREGNVYVASFTTSGDFPVTGNGFQTEKSGGRDIVLAKFDKDLTTLLASTYLGGASDEGECFITLDEEGSLYVTGSTMSDDFPTTSGAYDRSTPVTEMTVFVAKFSSDLATLQASTLLGARETVGGIAGFFPVETRSEHLSCGWW